MARNDGTYNFLDPKLGPKVTASCPSTDGHEVSNLISADAAERSRGFLAYSPIRPPVDIEFELACPVSLSHVILRCSVGTQTSTGFELQAKKAGDREEFAILARVFTRSRGDVAICDRRSRAAPVAGAPLDVHNFRASEHGTFLRAAVVRLRIIRTDGSVPCLGSIEIWGRPARECSDETRRTIGLLMNRSRNASAAPVANDSAGPSSASSSKREREPSPQPQPQPQPAPFDVPEDFLDPITADVMCVPMTLPCGKNVDRSTLERHREAEARWGRAPSDPFTGRPFTDGRRPVLNDALKRRIDEFLVVNAHRSETWRTSRTAGKRFRFTGAGVIEKCVSCDRNENLYSLLVCGHYICRECLTCSVSGSGGGAGEQRCARCGAQFSTADAVRHHQVTGNTSP